MQRDRSADTRVYEEGVWEVASVTYQQEGLLDVWISGPGHRVEDGLKRKKERHFPSPILEFPLSQHGCDEDDNHPEDQGHLRERKRWKNHTLLLVLPRFLFELSGTDKTKNQAG